MRKQYFTLLVVPVLLVLSACGEAQTPFTITSLTPKTGSNGCSPKCSNYDYVLEGGQSGNTNQGDRSTYV